MANLPNCIRKILTVVDESDDIRLKSLKIFMRMMHFKRAATERQLYRFPDVEFWQKCCGFFTDDTYTNKLFETIEIFTQNSHILAESTDHDAHSYGILRMHTHNHTIAIDCFSHDMEFNRN